MTCAPPAQHVGASRVHLQFASEAESRDPSAGRPRPGDFPFSGAGCVALTTIRSITTFYKLELLELIDREFEERVATVGPSIVDCHVQRGPGFRHFSETNDVGFHAGVTDQD